MKPDFKKINIKEVPGAIDTAAWNAKNQIEKNWITP